MKKREKIYKKLIRKYVLSFSKRLIIRLLFVLILHISPIIINAQTKNVTINIKDGNIEDVLKEIHKQTDINYLLNHEEIPKNIKVTVKIKKGSIDEALKQCFKHTELTYEIIDNVIIVKPRGKNILGNNTGNILVQTIRGTIIDRESKATLPGANIIVLNSDPLIGGVSDNEGHFRLENVPIGRHTLQITYVGYENLTIPEILVGSAKEVILTLQLTESITNIEEVAIRPYAKGKPKNEMAVVSARSFSVEEAGRYAATVGDPARMALVYAGVNGDDDITNQIVIRGNSPSGMLWRVEGVQIPNPNHFYAEGMDYGGISILSVNMMGKSDFFTGAFPAEYGNATSGVFDISLRNGNNKKREHTVQAGLLGVDLSMEGPFNKNYNGSFLFNYRYSTTYLFNLIGLEIFGDKFPSWSDLSFKLNMPTKKAGTFSFWGLGGLSNMESEALTDSAFWTKEYLKEGYTTNPAMGATGLTHIYFPGMKSYIKTIVSYSGNMHNDDYYELDNNYNKQSYYKESFHSGALRFSSLYNRKFSSRFTLRTGLIYSILGYNINLESRDEDTDQWTKDTYGKGSTEIYQAYLQTKLRITDKLTFNSGIHYLRMILNNDYSIEPRAGLKLDLGNSQSISAGFGIHSRHESIATYFVRENLSDNNFYYPNKNLDLTKAVHYVLSYDKMFKNDIRFKTEVYYQDIFTLPVSADSSRASSPINDEVSGEALVDDGKGLNYGIEFTLEKFFTNDYYFLITSSIFNSKYKPLSGKWHNTRYNTGYISNIVGGKQYELRNNRLLGVNFKFIWGGGKRYTPINVEQMKAENGLYSFEYYIEDKRFSEKLKDYIRLDLGVNYRINKAKVAHIISIDIQNATLRRNVIGKNYDIEEDQFYYNEMAGIVPALNYRLEF